VATSKKLIENVEAIQPHRPLHPTEQADLDQAHGVVVGAAKKLIDNVAKMPPEAQQHPTVQKDLTEAQQTVEAHSQKPENQSAPRQEAQKKEAADQSPTPAPAGTTHSSSGSLPPGDSATTHGTIPPTGTSSVEAAPSAGSNSGPLTAPDQQAPTTVNDGQAPQSPPTGQPSSTAPAAKPTTPPLSVAQSQKLIHNVMNLPPEERGHPKTQANVAQARTVVQEHVQRLESQKEPLSETQQKELAGAHAVLARLEPSLPSKQHVSGGRPGLPEGAKLLQSSEHWFIFEQGGKKWVRFYAPEAHSPNTAKKGGVGDGGDTSAALLTPENRIYVEDGQHRLNEVVLEDKTNQNSLPRHPKWLEYEFKGSTEAKGKPPAYNPGEPHENVNRINPWDGMPGY
jgi:hypothetical protein